MKVSLEKTSEDKINRSLHFFYVEDIMSNMEIASLKQIIDGQVYLVNAKSNFEIDEAECVHKAFIVAKH